MSQKDQNSLFFPPKPKTAPQPIIAEYFHCSLLPRRGQSGNDHVAIQDILDSGIPEDPRVLGDVDEAVLLDGSVHSLDPTVLVVDPQQLQVRIVLLDVGVEVLADVEVGGRVGVRADKDSAFGVLKQQL